MNRLLQPGDTFKLPTNTRIDGETRWREGTREPYIDFTTLHTVDYHANPSANWSQETADGWKRTCNREPDLRDRTGRVGP